MQIRHTAVLSALATIPGFMASSSGYARTVEVQTGWCPGGEIISNVEISSQERITAFVLKGALRTTPPGGLLDKTSSVCHVALSTAGGRRVAAGNCALLDKDGDKIAFRFQREGTAPGTGEVTTGTGKFAGIAGTNTYTTEPLNAFPNDINLCIDVAWKLQLP